MLRQTKKTPSGELRSWALDLEAMNRLASWAPERPESLEQEATELLASFPTLLGAVGRPLEDDRCWVEAAEPVLCPECHALVVFDRGTRCADCQREVTAPHDAVVGFIGRIPALISDRPFLDGLTERLASLERSEPGRAALWRRALLNVKGKRYLAPRYGLWFGHSWPHSDPPVMVWSEYFDMLDVPPDHVFYADEYFRLCLYAAWRERPAREVLQNRVVPRLLIDLMVADLEALGRMGEALARLEVSLYELYNMVGRNEPTGRFKRVYQELISQGRVSSESQQ